jgi:hypothetical protein
MGRRPTMPRDSERGKSVPPCSTRSLHSPRGGPAGARSRPAADAADRVDDSMTGTLSARDRRVFLVRTAERATVPLRATIPRSAGA